MYKRRISTVLADEGMCVVCSTVVIYDGFQIAIMMGDVYADIWRVCRKGVSTELGTTFYGFWAYFSDVSTQLPNNKSNPCRYSYQCKNIMNIMFHVCLLYYFYE